MTQVVQIRRDIRAIIDLYTGPERELTYVTDAEELRIHDDATPGGHRFLPMHLNDLLYQRRSPELDALSALNQIRGILIRTGAASYAARKIVGTADQITVSNSDGFFGDIAIALPALIDKAIDFVQTIDFLNGLTGNLTGNVTGNLTGNVTGNADGAHTGSFTGHVDVRGSNLQLDDFQIPLSKLAALPALATDPGVLKASAGGSFILQWSGTVASIPAGWQLCDGTNNTPDLRDRFIIGAGAGSNPGQTGGSQGHNHTATSANGGAHNHTVTVNGHALTVAEMPSHAHGSGVPTNTSLPALHGTLPASGNNRFDNNGGSRSLEIETAVVGGGASHNHTATTATSATHSHGITVNQNADTRPPFYALCFIMRIP